MSMITTFKEYVSDGFKDEIIDFSNNGKCSSCGNCCNNHLPMNKKEINRIKKFIRENNIKAITMVTPLARAPIDMTCPFKNNASKICTIYSVRPKVCRLFLCSKPKEAKVNREKFANTMQMIDVRKEFFNK